MSLAFNIEQCSAWLPGIDTQQDLVDWANNKKRIDPANAVMPALKQVPAMQRRRLSPFAKITLATTLDVCADLPSEHIDTVFSSRHGDLKRTALLIEDVAQQETLSPTQFGLSVHNAVAGLYSIFTKNKAPMSAVAAGEQSFMTGLLDAVSKLQANHLQRILYVYSDYDIPEYYRPYVNSQECACSIALLLSADTGTQCQLSPMSEPCDAEGYQPLDFLQKFYSGQPSCQLQSGGLGWQLTIGKKQ
ncbi:hypothetical protein DS2_07318 [Catenovulum agarivorans DS-2]|uniref:Beta-ketoacyl synthase-like N-terminal domain-containing protein n=1 Tax=Catenovulum agarivorans DS-2 TaxID=1328313 RepID=W7QS03_9ALTE|nr:beta-ketoacyl synthase chain length factor [Catenovulum agarivorans]EWH10623.1 hypothetical protein DS2_07318 [Catenovulum agarivorans DS-2]